MVFYISIIALCMIIPIGILMNYSVERYHYNQFVQGIKNGESTLSYSEKEMDAYTVYTDMRDLYAPSFGIYGSYRSFTVADRRTNEIYSSDGAFLMESSPVFLNDLFLSSNFLSAMAGSPVNSDRLQTLRGSSFYDYSLTKENLVLHFRYYKADWQSMVDSFNQTLLSGLIVAVVVAFVVGYMMSRAISVPIKDITVRTKSISEGDFGKTLDVRSDDEIGQLSLSINDMSYSLMKMVDEISAEKNKMEIILDNIEGGVLAFDKEGNIIHSNPAAHMLLNLASFDFTLDEFIESYCKDISVDKDSDPYKETIITLDDRTLALSMAAFYDALGQIEGNILLFRDITRQHRLDIMRKEFVANVSHELKTPLTTIKSFSEALLDGVKDKKTEQHFLQVIEDEADRMNNLVMDLLQLSAMDMGQMSLDKTKSSVTELIKQAVNAVEAQSMDKNHEIIVDMQYKDYAYFDFKRMLQCVINLLVNAVKYTDEGGSISISVFENEGSLCITVQDNGIGISKKDQERIFERFYRVDRARTRVLGGSGLGLAISADIIKLHGGEITLESRADKGTKVSLCIPKGEEL